MIEAAGISKSFKGVRAVSDVSFKVNEGEIFGLVGPDGGGKSSLLRMMSSILKPDSGSITLGGINIFNDPYRAKESMAYMPQRFGLYEDLTVEENIFFFGRIFNVKSKEIKKRLVRLYDFSQLGPFKNRLAGKLSGGMKQKLGLACCLVHAPKLILLDEPTNGVDPISRREFWKILYDLLAEKVTIIVSTAYLDEAERCNRLALMYEGSFIIVGNPDSVKKMTGMKLIEVHVSNPRDAETIIKNSKQFNTVIRTGTSLRIFDKNVLKAKRNIKAVLNSKKIEYHSIGEINPSLEDSFIQIISEEDLG